VARIRQGIFESFAPQYEARGLAVIPVVANGKQPAIKDWQEAGKLTPSQRLARFKAYGQCNIGLLAGTPLSSDGKLIFIDVDQPDLVGFISAMLKGRAPSKVGKKGATFFCQTARDANSRKFKLKGQSAPAVEIFASSGQTVLPPSIHPSGAAYRWTGRSLLETSNDDLPALALDQIDIIEKVVQSPHTWEIFAGGASGKFHQAMLSLTSTGIANVTNDLEGLAQCLNALLPIGYRGNTASETLGMLQSAKSKGLGLSRRRSYDPQESGPIPLGYTRDNTYAFLDPLRQIIVPASAQQLLSQQWLLGLSPSSFWAKQFPHDKSVFNAYAAGEA
jgi:hypothetical protein